jgi:hypothetical protein
MKRNLWNWLWDTRSSPNVVLRNRSTWPQNEIAGEITQTNLMSMRDKHLNISEGALRYGPATFRKEISCAQRDVRYVNFGSHRLLQTGSSDFLTGVTIYVTAWWRRVLESSFGTV